MLGISCWELRVGRLAGEAFEDEGGCGVGDGVGEESVGLRLACEGCEREGDGAGVGEVADGSMPLDTGGFDGAKVADVYVGSEGEHITAR